MAGYSDIEILFIREELNQHAEYLADLFTEAIAKKDLRDTGELEDNFTGTDWYRIYEKGQQVVLSLSFPNHGRFIEIQQVKKSKIRSEKPDLNALLWGVKKNTAKKKRSKNAQWYTRNVYGAQNRLIGRLMYGLSDIERERLVGILKKK